MVAFTLLRRYADDLILALRPALFANYQSAPRKLAILVDRRNAGGLDKLEPIGNPEMLDQALRECTSWLSKLRGSENGGIRDILIHRPHNLMVMGTKRGKAPWKVRVLLTDERKRQHELLPILVECVDGICSLMTLLCQAIGVLKGYTESLRMAFGGVITTSLATIGSAPCTGAAT